MYRLQNKIIIVTGGNGLIGRELVKKINNEGAVCYNADIKVDSSIDGEIYCNINDVKSVDSLIEEVFNKHGRIDGLVNNAYPRTEDWGNKFEDIKLESWKKNVDMQLNSVFYICQQVLKIMKKQEYGSIVNISSIYGVVASDFSVYEKTDGMTSPAAYSAIKSGLINFSRYLASYYGKNGIRVNCVSPGGIKDNQNTTFIENYSKKVPLKRLGRPSEISPAVSFLLSDEASYITGQNLIVDGGWTSI
jgi:NAD(P)-dependent dehydrogenase (short-subunit alcohol dehydrogenase family)